VLRLTTLGGLSLASDTGALMGAAVQPRPLALLALLAVAGEAGMTREQVMLHLWPDSTPERARNVLKQTLYALRRDLKSPDLLYGANPIRLNPTAITSDYSALLEALAADDWTRATVLYRGPFLHDFSIKDSPEFEQWRTREAERLERMVRGVVPPVFGASPDAGVAGAASLQPAPTPVVRPRPRLHWLGAAAAVVLGAVAAVRAVRLPAQHASLDPDLVLIAPFAVYDGRLALWREGLVDVLARDFDRAGPLRTIPPAAAIRVTREVGDVPAAAVAARLGAGLVVSGTVLPIGRDSVRLTASVSDLAGDRELGDVDLRGPADRMGELTDSLALRLLRDVGQVRSITAAPSVSLRATSLPALKTFLQGEQFFRRSEFDSAIVYYERALSQDSSLALAYYRLANAMGWVRPGTEALQEAYSIRAGELTAGLTPSDSLLLTAHALQTRGIAAYVAAGTGEPGADPDLSRDAPPGPSPEAERQAADGWEAAERLFATLEVAIRRYPYNPDIWYHLGEARVHFGPLFGVPTADALTAFDRAIALDSSFAPAWEHTTDALPIPDGLITSRRYAERYLARLPGGGSESTLLAFLALSAPGIGVDSAVRLLAGLPPGVREGLLFLYKRYPDSAEIAVHLARSLLAQDPASVHPAIQRVGVRALAYRGHLREALALSRRPDSKLLSITARLGITPGDSAAALFSAWLPDRRPQAARGLPWWALVRDSASLRAFVRWQGREAASAEGVHIREMHRWWETVGRGYLALAFGDSAEALRDFSSAPERLCPACLEERLVRAKLLAAAGRWREAAAILEHRPDWIDLSPSPVEVFWALEEARTAERLGARDRARWCYRVVAEAWRYGDPELRPFVGEAEVGMAR
jgi:tetratricopeptide (TPR) repeat protein